MARTPLLTPAEVADWLGVSPETLKSWRMKTRYGTSTGPMWVPFGNGPKAHIRYREIDVTRWIDAQMERAS